MPDEELFEKAMHDACEAELDGYLSQFDERQEHVFSDEFERQMDRMLRSYVKNRRLKKLLRFSKRAAVFFVAGFVGLSACLLSVEAWRNKLFEMVEKKYPAYSEISYQPIKGTPETDLSQYQLVEYRPTYLPEGFRLTRQLLDENANWCEYTNAEDSGFSFQQSMLGTVNSSINTEGSALIRFELNGNDAYKMSNHGAQFVLWSDERYEFSLVGYETDMTLEQAVEIARSVTVSPRGAPHPPKAAIPLDERPMDYSFEAAVKNGDVTVRDQTVWHLERLEAFFADIEAGKPSIICVADYDQPKLITHEFYFDGFRVNVETDTTRRDGDENNQYSEQRNYKTILRAEENGATVLYGIERTGERRELFRYKDAG